MNSQSFLIVLLLGIKGGVLFTMESRDGYSTDVFFIYTDNQRNASV